MKNFFSAGLAALGAIAACGGSTEVKSICGSGDCVGKGAQSGSGGVAGAGPGGGSDDGGSSFRPGGTGGVSGTGASSGSGGNTPDSGPIDAGAPDGPASCPAVSVQVGLLERDIFLVVDQSASMVDNGSNRWTFVMNGIIDAVSSPQMMGIGLGIGYFGMHQPGSPPVDPAAPGSCNPSDYARPDVPIGVLPAGGAEITESLRRRTPGGGTPTLPALQGALQYAAQWAVSHPARKTVVALLSDGAPQGCLGNDIASVTRVAGAGAANSPQIPTYVIGVGGVQGLDAIAQAGGTNQALVVDDTNTRQQVLEALIQIAGRLTTCEFTLPRDGREIDFDKVNVRHTPIGGSDGVIYFVDGPADCGVATGGWYYVPEASETPTAIKLCPSSCDMVKRGGRVDIIFGCPTLRPPLQKVVTE